MIKSICFKPRTKVYPLYSPFEPKLHVTFYRFLKTMDYFKLSQKKVSLIFLFLKDKLRAMMKNNPKHLELLNKYLHTRDLI